MPGGNGGDLSRCGNLAGACLKTTKRKYHGVESKRKSFRALKQRMARWLWAINNGNKKYIYKAAGTNVLSPQYFFSIMTKIIINKIVFITVSRTFNWSASWLSSTKCTHRHTHGRARTHSHTRTCEPIANMHARTRARKHRQRHKGAGTHTPTLTHPHASAHTHTRTHVGRHVNTWRKRRLIYLRFYTEKTT